ncbi:hypothetical protein B0H17DRAFT_1173617 [Mycena rosella]|uniref:Uncharacterized protein n=1 Tax=Mycena rosella TaxID=1033263 RepID=A0AAD7H330_MYCRO|nr:hypothetical protein B0H17DRAFT_1173617 [Mycena rosella]
MKPVFTPSVIRNSKELPNTVQGAEIQSLGLVRNNEWVTSVVMAKGEAQVAARYGYRAYISGNEGEEQRSISNGANKEQKDAKLIKLEWKEGRERDRKESTRGDEAKPRDYKERTTRKKEGTHFPIVRLGARRGNARTVVAADVAVAEYKDGAGNAEKVDEVDAEGGARDADAEMVQKTRWGAGGGVARGGGSGGAEAEDGSGSAVRNEWPAGIAAVTAGERSGDRGGAQRRRQEWQRRRCVEQWAGHGDHDEDKFDRGGRRRRSVTHLYIERGDVGESDYPVVGNIRGKMGTRRGKRKICHAQYEERVSLGAGYWRRGGGQGHSASALILEERFWTWRAWVSTFEHLKEVSCPEASAPSAPRQDNPIFPVSRGGHQLLRHRRGEGTTVEFGSTSVSADTAGQDEDRWLGDVPESCGNGQGRDRASFQQNLGARKYSNPNPSAPFRLTIPHLLSFSRLGCIAKPGVHLGVTILTLVVDLQAGLALLRNQVCILNIGSVGASDDGVHLGVTLVAPVGILQVWRYWRTRVNRRIFVAWEQVMMAPSFLSSKSSKMWLHRKASMCTICAGKIYKDVPTEVSDAESAAREIPSAVAATFPPPDLSVTDLLAVKLPGIAEKAPQQLPQDEGLVQHRFAKLTPASKDRRDVQLAAFFGTAAALNADTVMQNFAASREQNKGSRHPKFPAVRVPIQTYGSEFGRAAKKKDIAGPEAIRLSGSVERQKKYITEGGRRRQTAVRIRRVRSQTDH